MAIAGSASGSITRFCQGGEIGRVQSVFLQRRRLVLVDLRRAPLDEFGQDAVERLFALEQVEEVLELAGQWEIGSER